MLDIIKATTSIIMSLSILSIAFFDVGIKKFFKVFNNCVFEIVEKNNTYAEAVRYCNGGNLIHL